MFITPAYAQDALAGAPSMLVQILPFVLIFAIMYFLIIRPQRQRMKKHQEMVANLRRGDTVVTSGGLIGKVAKVVDDGEIQIELTEGVKVRIVRSMVQEVRTKSEPAKEGA
ncbi:preprotein translocase subunit YajC [Roseibium sp. RKSG952]|uniref:preprotein translocase subunit YajC n=1 Tax=Roseibium sp. RKSG952 TaxID=2529384 RepID=UPI0012BCDC27|nr:preprotein translocase subunit YajC [Roseibium sp. RKSG952]MTH97260.1 preprotein translocase subunit YajC [Roseibium sp. RKSG952]